MINTQTLTVANTTIKKQQFIKINTFRIKHKILYFLIITFIIFVCLVAIFILNIRFPVGSNHHQFTFAQIFQAINTPNWYNLPADDNLDYPEIANNIWGATATIIGATGLAVTGLITQSLTRNPLADGSTLGLTQAATFGIVGVISMGYIHYGYEYIGITIGVIICIILLFLIVIFIKTSTTSAKIILAGLSLGIIFKTLTFIFKQGDPLANSFNFAYILGGAESIYRISLAPSPWIALLISFLLVTVGTIISFINAKYMTVLELGPQKSKQLGINILMSRIMSMVALAMLIPGAAILVGSVSFIGLFSAHISRYLLKTRDYKYTMVVSIFVASFIGSLGYQLYSRVPQINSSIWMTFIGAPYLIYIGIKGLK